MFPPDENGYRVFFYSATGNEPFPYQIGFAFADPLPSMLHVPTGAGKTATAILGWLWRRRFAYEAIRSATPRRLVYCLPMRVLVEQTYTETRKWLAALNLLPQATQEREGEPEGEGGSPISVSLLMGGETGDNWDLYPERDAIIIGTQDMLLSRALNRGYAMSRYRWPVQFAFLNNDCFWVMDEVQLMGCGLPTTAQLQAFRAAPPEGLGTYGPVHTLWMSATPKVEGLQTVDFAPNLEIMQDQACLLTEEDRRYPQLSQRLMAEKILAMAETALNKANVKGNYERNLAQEILARHCPDALTLVVLNRVQRAQDVFRLLKELVAALRAQGKTAPELLLIHSRYRPVERQALQQRLGALDREYPPAGCIVVSTQAVEAGVDISARVLFTELAPWTSLVQRFGRCNRRGEWQGDSPAHVFWIDIEVTEKNEDLALPYAPEDLAWARETLAGLTDAGPRTVTSIEDPAPFPLTSVLRRRDLVDLFDTTPDLAGNDLDVSRYIRGNKDNDVHVYWREWEGEDPPAEAYGPYYQEVCPVSLGAIRSFLKNACAYRWDALEGHWSRVSGTNEFTVWPGLTLVLPAAGGGYEEELGWTGKLGLQVRPIDLPTKVTPTEEAYNDEPSVFARRFITLQAHLGAVVRAMEGLAGALAHFQAIPWDELRLAARWHDAGKAHPAFQNALLEGKEENDPLRHSGPWAKSGGKNRRLNYGLFVQGIFQKRRHFRHELAGALLLLQSGAPNLVSYLVAAHHGKVRLSIRSMPGEQAAPHGRRFARGIWEGDEIPTVDLGDGLMTLPAALRLEVMELGEGSDGPSWLERTLNLRREYGPFQLAWLETLLRVADWRASQEEDRAEEEVRPYA